MLADVTQEDLEVCLYVWAYPLVPLTLQTRLTPFLQSDVQYLLCASISSEAVFQVENSSLRERWWLCTKNSVVFSMPSIEVQQKIHIIFTHYGSPSTWIIWPKGKSSMYYSLKLLKPLLWQSMDDSVNNLNIPKWSIFYFQNPKRTTKCYASCLVEGGMKCSNSYFTMLQHIPDHRKARIFIDMPCFWVSLIISFLFLWLVHAFVCTHMHTCIYKWTNKNIYTIYEDGYIYMYVCVCVLHTRLTREFRVVLLKIWSSNCCKFMNYRSTQKITQPIQKVT